MDNANVTQLKDFYIAAILLASGKFKLLKLIKNPDRVSTFIFQGSQEEADSIIQAHWNRENKVISRDLIESINELKARLYGG